ncbi:Retrotransposon gag domain [Sesbania bispinosa]|nr:Retrotransposon gag domain [Sesbania bispinosa]
MNLSIPPYTGEADPGRHLDVFMNEMLFQQANQDLQCRIFPRSLQGESLTWFKSLQPNSVNNWEDLVLAFSKRFSQAGEIPRDS